jgi:hypothetical protein
MTDRDLKPSQSGVFDAVIVGAGFAALAAHALGLQPVVLEKAGVMEETVSRPSQ